MSFVLHSSGRCIDLILDFTFKRGRVYFCREQAKYAESVECFRSGQHLLHSYAAHEHGFVYTRLSKYRTYGPLSGNYTLSFGVCGMRGLKRMLRNSFTRNRRFTTLPPFTLFTLRALPVSISWPVIKHRVFALRCYCYPFF